jgi:alkylation response protein AidB-like acyl-CoA dehydrogenase
MLSDNSPRGSAPLVNGLHAPAPPLQRVVDLGLLRCAVPTRLGGNGGCLDDLANDAGLLQHQDPEAAAVLWAQRLAIEALIQTRNAGLRELWLPDFLSGNRAATLAPGGKALASEDTGRGWLLSGQLHGVPNLPWEGFSLVAPGQLGDGNAGWVLLRSEEDGLSVHPAPEPHGNRPAHASIRLNRVFFREDEWLGDHGMAQLLAPVSQALKPCRPHAAAVNT